MSSSSPSPSQKVKNQNTLGSSSQAQPTHRKGKLRSISKAVKEKAFKQLEAQSDVFDSPSARLTVSQESVNKNSGRKSRVKRKSTDDDEFVPEESRAKRRTSTRRKREPVPYVDGKKLKANVNKHHLPTASPCHSLIAGLLGATQSTVRTPRTPIHPRIGCAKTPTKSRTPTDLCKPLISSSLVVLSANNQPRSVQQTGVEIAILSSNSKPVPASPNAESTAISGHANCKDLASEERKGDIHTSDTRNDPFRQRRDSQKITSFTRRLTGNSAATDHANMSTHPDKEGPDFETGDLILVASQQAIDSTQVEQPVCETRSPEVSQAFLHSQNVPPVAAVGLRIIKKNQRMYLDRANPSHFEDGINVPKHDTGDQTACVPEALPDRFRSSPSSHSSTSAELELLTGPSLPSSQAEEMEWEANLQPHQRALHELLVRISKRVMRHIVDNETAVTDIAQIFARDGEHILNSLLQRHDSDYGIVFSNMVNKKKDLEKELEHAAKHIAIERIRVNAIV